MAQRPVLNHHENKGAENNDMLLLLYDNSGDEYNVMVDVDYDSIDNDDATGPKSSSAAVLMQADASSSGRHSLQHPGQPYSEEDEEVGSEVTAPPTPHSTDSASSNEDDE